ncbi:YihY/virulence factor BrkB family protein [Thioclava electrotropha]|uniref:YihY/virulence factor BrkB family protein n=1 Tax=Thioclava electrotropha TaxID=1549850 RepID=A0ABX6YYI2_9RHOB|nr:YihY/virulence factor BrkB family protein [Thioclava electrotropha]QPZ92929.1 YihY/virulence factor BrkB family protein [Thioclava electrotropha]
MRETAKFAVSLFGRLFQSNITLVSAGVAFYSMLAIFPGISATIALWSAFADPTVIRTYLNVADDFIPPEAYALINDQIQNWLIGPRATIGLGVMFSAAVTLFSARAGVAALVLSLNVIHGTRPRATIWSFIMGYLMTIALVGVMLAAMATVVVVPVVINFLPFHEYSKILLSGLPWAAMLLLMLTALGILYRYGPNTEGKRDPILTLGAVLATALWGLSSIGLTFYLSNFGNYNKIYGSIGAVIALLVWLYLSAFSVLMGAALNAELAAFRKRRAQEKLRDAIEGDDEAKTKEAPSS